MEITHKRCQYCGYARNQKNIAIYSVNQIDLAICLLCRADLEVGLIDEIPEQFAWHPLNPIAPTHDKQNLKYYHLILRDGTVVRLTRLFAEQRIRENIIFHHTVKFLAQINYIAKPSQLEIIKRDDPWDYSVKTQCGKEFNIEITEFADTKSKQKYDDRELEINKLFRMRIAPYIKIKKAIDFLDLKDIDFPSLGNGNNKTLVKNPLFGRNSDSIFITNSGEFIDNVNIATEAIRKKIEKKHQDKKDTILVLDNRSTFFDSSHYDHLLKNPLPYLPFKEILIYTGYFSNQDGNRAEYTLFSLATNPELTELTQQSNILVEQRTSVLEVLTDQDWY